MEFYTYFEVFFSIILLEDIRKVELNLFCSLDVFKLHCRGIYKSSGEAVIAPLLPLGTQIKSVLAGEEFQLTKVRRPSSDLRLSAGFHNRLESLQLKINSLPCQSQVKVRTKNRQ